MPSRKALYTGSFARACFLPRSGCLGRFGAWPIWKGRKLLAGFRVRFPPKNPAFWTLSADLVSKIPSERVRVTASGMACKRG